MPFPALHNQRETLVIKTHLLLVLSKYLEPTPHADIMSLNKFVVRQKRKRTGAAGSKSGTETAGKFLKRETETWSTKQRETETETRSTAQHFSKLKAGSAKDPTTLDKVDSPLTWHKIRAQNLDLDYVRLYKRSEADDILRALEETVTYNTGQQAQVLMFGKWVDIPRKQVKLRTW